MKRIAAITMARNDEFFLERWVRYYSHEIGRENLYVYLDGKDQPVPVCAEGVRVELVDKLPGKIVEMEKHRLDFLSGVANDLLDKGYDIVIGCDVDEFVVVDPALGMSLADYLSQARIETSLSPLGIDIGQNMRCEGAFTGEQGFFDERRYGRICTRYTKPTVVNSKVSWGRGFHRIHGKNFHIAKGLYLFHFGYFDMKRIEDRFADKDRQAQGVKKHIAKRAKTIHINSTEPIREWDGTVEKARMIQQWTRQPLCWNKPAMWEMKWVVKVPERFVGII